MNLTLSVCYNVFCLDDSYIEGSSGGRGGAGEFPDAKYTKHAASVVFSDGHSDEKLK